MIKLTRAHVQPIGLDIGHDSIKMLQVEVVGDSLEVVAAARMAVPEEARRDWQTRVAVSTDLIRQMLHRNAFRGRGVTVSLPREVVHVKNVRLPLIPPAELEQAVLFEAKSLFPFDIDHAMVRFLPAGEVRQGSEARQEVIILAARNEDVDNFVEQIHRSDVVIESIDVEFLALFRSVERFIRRREDEQEVSVIVDIGARASQVVIGRGRELSFYKQIDIGGRHLHEAVSRKLGITVEEAQVVRQRLIETPDEAATGGKRDPVRQAVYDATRSIMEDLGREISLCLRYYSVTFRGHRPTKLRLVGGEASDPQLLALLNSNLTIPVEAGRPLHSINTSRIRASDRRGTMSEWAQALGLGLRHTKTYFGARDGKPRDPNKPREDLQAEVVDLNKIAEAAAPATPAAATPAAQAATPQKEVAHAGA
jgi:type IV pilus assembly protein PilM